MGKRKEVDGSTADVSRRKNKDNEDESSGGEDFDMLDVEFEWFDPQQQDFHGLKTLMRQLFDSDNTLFDLSELADLILSQPLLGSTVKTDGNESDPFAFLTVLNMHAHKEKASIQKLGEYIIQKTASTPLAEVSQLFSASSDAQVGLILTERFMNMPAEIVPPMYNMLLEEIQWALEEKEPYQFTHYLIISKVYTEVESKVDQEESRPSKKKRKDGGSSELFYFHPEDEVLHNFALGHSTFDYTKQGDEGASDSKRAFYEMGVKPQGHVILLEASKLQPAVEAIKAYVGAGAS